LFFVALSGLAPAGAVAETTWYVDVGACPNAGTGAELDPFCRIQDGIDAAIAGDTVLVLPGTYWEYLDFQGEAITVRSRDGAEATTIQTPDTRYEVVKFDDGEGPDAVLNGFTLKSNEEYVAIRINGSHPSIVDCILTENSLGIGCQDGGARVSNCQFLGNHSTIVGGIDADGCDLAVEGTAFRGNVGGFSAGAILIEDGSLTLDRCTFEANEGRSGAVRSSGALEIIASTFRGNSGSFGGAVLQIGGRVRISNCEFEANTSEDFGGAVAILYDVEATITGSAFSNNTAVNDGGALVLDTSRSTVEGCTFINNTAKNGGGIQLRAGRIDVRATAFVNNSASEMGGGIGGPIQYASSVSDCLFNGNTAQDSGGMDAWNDEEPWFISDCDFVGNEAQRFGGGLTLAGGPAQVAGCLFQENNATRGAAAELQLGTQILQGCLFIKNSGLNGAISTSFNSRATLDRCAFRENVGRFAGTLSLGSVGSMTIRTCEFVRNQANAGAGVARQYGGDVTVVNSAFIHNMGEDGHPTWVTEEGHLSVLSSTMLMAHQPSDAMLILGVPGTSITVENTILRSATDRAFMAFGESFVAYSNVEGGLPEGASDGGGNIDVDPSFVDPDDNLRLNAHSPCIDAGDNEAIAGYKVDLDGNARIVNDVVDMGAYEYQGPRVIEVRIDVRPGNGVNPIKPGSRGVLPIAILSSDSFDALTVDPSTVMVSAAGVALRGNGRRYMTVERDVNHDDLVDLVVHVESAGVDVEVDTFKVALTGETYDGTPIYGSDIVRTVGR